MPVKDILLLGNPRLLERCTPVEPSEWEGALAVGRELHDTLMDFRAKHGWGRAIAAPQIGVGKRIIYLHVDRPWLLLNPVAFDHSEETFELWDDCMSFPDLLVRVRRHRSFSLSYCDEHQQEQTIFVEGLLSELIQHELDHLEGVLAVSRAIDGAAFALQSQRALLIGASFANGCA